MIQLGIFPSDPTLGVELQQAISSTYGSTSPGEYRIARTYQPGALRAGNYTQSLHVPMGGNVYFYRARHVAPVGSIYTDGAFTDVVAVSPTPEDDTLFSSEATDDHRRTGGGGDDQDELLVPVDFAPGIMAGAGAIKSTSIQPGTPGSTFAAATLSKTLSIAPNQFVPTSTAQTYVRSGFGEYVAPGAGGGLGTNLFSGFILPVGVTLTDINVSMAQDSTADVVTVALYKQNAASTTVTTLLTLTSTGVGWHTVMNSTVSDTPSSGDRYAITAVLNPAVANTTAAALGTVSFNYTMADYKEAY